MLDNESINRTLNYYYDKRGNRVKDCLRENRVEAEYKYDYNNLLIESSSHVSGNSQTLEFNYGADNQRYRKLDIFNNEITLYANKDYEEIYDISGSLKQRKYYITSYMTITKDQQAGRKVNFMQKDRLGSTTQILDESGTVLHTKSYDAFGKPRNGDWSDMAGGLFQAKLEFTDTNGTIDLTKRGFTDHEHLDEMQLIHMNGRMFDYNNGRFLSVDPFIQAPTSTQSMNPYTYILNNPLSGVDPTGYCFTTDSNEKCGSELQAGESENITDENGDVAGSVSRGDNNEKIFHSNKNGVTGVQDNGFEGPRQTVKSANDKKISELQSKLRGLKNPKLNKGKVLEITGNIKTLERQTEFFSRCTDSPGGCGFGIDGAMAEHFIKITEAFGNLVASSAAGRVSSKAITSQLQKIRVRTEGIIKRGDIKLNSQGLTKTVQNYEKHTTDRLGGTGTFLILRGSNASKNAFVNDFIRNILNNPRIQMKKLSGGATQYRLPNNGQGIRVESNGVINFLDPNIAL